MTRYPAWASPYPNLKMSDGVAAILLTEDEQFVLQHRDDIPHNLYPGCWGCFGCADDVGESAVDALQRELMEELEFTSVTAEHISTLEFDLRPHGLEKYFRACYRIRLNNEELSNAELHEGQTMKVYSYAELGKIAMSPYDAFVLNL